MNSLRSPGHEEGIEHRVAPGAEVEQELNGGGDVAVGAGDAFDGAPGAFEEEFHLQRVGRDDGVVVGGERFLDDGRHPVEAHGVGGGAHLAALFLEALPVAPFSSEAAHTRVVVAEAEHAEKIGAGEGDAPADLGDARQFADEGLGFIDVFEDVERADAGEVGVGEGQAAAVVKLAAVGEFAGAFDVRFGDIDAVRLEAGFGEAGDDLADAAADVEGAGAGPEGLQGVGVFGVEGGVPAGEEFRVGFVALASRA